MTRTSNLYIRYVLGIILCTAGCISLWLQNSQNSVPSFMFFCLAAISLNYEQSRIRSKSENWIIFFTLLILISAPFLFPRLTPMPLADKFEYTVHDPIFVSVLWALLVFAVYFRWKREKKNIQD